MDPDAWFDREIRQLEIDLEDNLITYDEFLEAQREIREQYNEMVEDQDRDYSYPGRR